MQLRQLGEFGLIRKIKDIVGQARSEVLVGIDDDAAVFQISPDNLILLTTDTLVENVHFDLRYFSFYNLGRKALSINISDIAAMGGIPLYAVISLAIPTHTQVDFIEELYRGLRDEAHQFGVSIIGGDTTNSKNDMFVSIALVGQVEKENLITRAGAKVGDAVCVTGELGASEAGLNVLRSVETFTDGQFDPLIEKHLTPQPRLEEARFLVKNLAVHAMIDISDGLASEINHICRLSGVGAEIYQQQIPLHPLASQVARNLEHDPLKYALTGGEDFELLFTAAEENLNAAAQQFQQIFGFKISIVGKIVPPEKGVQLITEKGTRMPLQAQGYDHFLIE